MACLKKSTRYHLVAVDIAFDCRLFTVGHESGIRFSRSVRDRARTRCRNVLCRLHVCQPGLSENTPSAIRRRGRVYTQRPLVIATVIPV